MFPVNSEHATLAIGAKMYTARQPLGSCVHCSDPLKAYFVQLAVISNHQNGRDTHIRQVKVFGPRQDRVQSLLAQDVGFSSPEMLMYSVVR